MEILVTIAVAIVAVLLAFMITAYYRLRALLSKASNREDDPPKG